VKKTLAASALTLGMLVAPLAGTASADPTDVYPAALNGSGSDTTEVVMRNLDAVIGDLGSWDIGPAGSTWDTNGAAAGCNFTGRIAGSTDGRRALANSVTNGDGCFQFARSSSRGTSQATTTLSGMINNGTGSGYTASPATVQMLPIALGVDGLTYAFRALSGTPRDLTLGQLRSIYSCTFSGTVDGRSMSSPTIPNQPLLPTDASGTRADWMSLMGLPAGADVASDPGGTLPSCVEDGPGDSGQAGGEFSEHNGNVLTNGRMIVPHSIGQYIAQGRSGTGDFRGLGQLGYINGNTPLQAYDNPGGVLNTGTASGSTVVDGAWFRTVYNNVAATDWNLPTVQAVFGVRSGGSNNAASDIPTVDSGAICLQDGLLLSYGFVPVC
jgi:hypothetical protein